MYKIFEGLKVIELASVLAGPSVGQFFAELGAKVIKVENPKSKGDVTRSWQLPTETPKDGVTAYFSAVNWGKESLPLDISDPNQLQHLYKLIQESDLVIASYKPLDAEKLKVDFETLHTLNPKLIYGHITGYGPDDPKVGYDAIIQAESGFVYMNGDPDGLPTKMPVALMDLLAAHQLKEALLIALLHRYKTGEGTYVTVSLLESGISSLANQATNYLNAGHIPQRIGSEHPNIVPYGTIFLTKDQKMIMLAVGTDKQFARLCTILGVEELAQDPDFSTNPQRVQNKHRLLPLLRSQISTFDKTPLLERLNAQKVPVGGVNDLSEVLDLPQAQNILLEDGGLKGIRQFVARYPNTMMTTLQAPPTFENL